jgi:hypothetical protein
VKRKLLSETQKEIVIGKDKSRCCRELLVQSRVYPFDVYCPGIKRNTCLCHKTMKYEDESIFHKKSKVDKFVEKWASKMGNEKTMMLNEYESSKDEKL